MPRGRPKQTDAYRNIKWIEKYCVIPEGKYVGRPVKLAPFMRDDLYAIYDNPHGTRRAIFSRGRKNAKTVECAFLVLLHLCGPEHKKNSNIFSAAQSREQAGILFGYAAKIIRMSPILKAAITIRDTAKQLYVPELGTTYRALSADAQTAMGLSPVMIIHDELGQVRGPRSELYDALETATAAQENPLSVVISTQAKTDSDLLSILIDDALAGHDPRTIVRFQYAPDDIDPYSDEAIRSANPAFDHFMNKEEVRSMARDAQRLPDAGNSYRNLVLNQRIETKGSFVSRELWDSCASPVASLGECPEVFGGLDLSAVSDLTALVLIGQIDGIWHVEPHFWLPQDGLLERSRLDRVPYDSWHKRGFLHVSPGKAVDYEFVADELQKIFARYHVSKIAFDRWNFSQLKPYLRRAGLGEEMIEAKFTEFGQGYKSMSPALRQLETLLLKGQIAHGGHPVLTMCASNATVQMDTKENRSLIKKKSIGRIDGMVALAMAVGAVPQPAVEPPKEYTIRIYG